MNKGLSIKQESRKVLWNRYYCSIGKVIFLTIFQVGDSVCLCPPKCSVGLTIAWQFGPGSRGQGCGLAIPLVLPVCAVPFPALQWSHQLKRGSPPVCGAWVRRSISETQCRGHKRYISWSLGTWKPGFRSHLSSELWNPDLVICTPVAVSHL